MPRPDIRKVSAQGVAKRQANRDKRRQLVKRLLNENMTRVSIRNLLGVSQSTIVADVKAIESGEVE